MSEIDYSFGEKDPEPGEEHRSEYRLTGQALVTLELEACAPDGGSDAGQRLQSFATRDLSAHGFRITTLEPLVTGALLPSRICLTEGGEPYRLTAEVMWCKPFEPGRWLVGLRIVESDETAYIDWVEAVAQAIDQD